MSADGDTPSAPVLGSPVIGNSHSQHIDSSTNDIPSSSLKTNRFLMRLKNRTHSSTNLSSEHLNNAPIDASADSTLPSTTAASDSAHIDNKKLLVPGNIARKLTRKIRPKNKLESHFNQLNAQLDNCLQKDTPQQPHSSPMSFLDTSPAITVDEYVSFKDTSANSNNNTNHNNNNINSNNNSYNSHSINHPSSNNQDQESAATSFFSFHRKSSDFGKSSSPSHSHHSSLSSVLDNLHFGRRSPVSPNNQTNSVKSAGMDSMMPSMTDEVSNAAAKGKYLKTHSKSFSASRLSFRSLTNASNSSLFVPEDLKNENESINKRNIHLTLSGDLSDARHQPSPLDINDTLALEEQEGMANATLTPFHNIQDFLDSRFDLSDILSRTSTVKYHSKGTAISDINDRSAENLSTYSRENVQFLQTKNENENGSSPTIKQPQQEQQQTKVTGLGIAGQPTSYKQSAIIRASRPKDIIVINNDASQSTTAPEKTPIKQQMDQSDDGSKKKFNSQSPASLLSPLSKLRHKTFSIFFDNHNEGSPMSTSTSSDRDIAVSPVSKFSSSESLNAHLNIQNEKFSPQSKPPAVFNKPVVVNRVRSNSLNNQQTSSMNRNSNTVYKNLLNGGTQSSRASSRKGSRSSSRPPLSRKGSSTGILSSKFSKSQLSLSLSKPSSPLLSMSARTGGSSQNLDGCVSVSGAGTGTGTDLSTKLVRRRSQTLSAIKNLSSSYNSSRAASLEKVNEIETQQPKLGNPVNGSSSSELPSGSNASITENSGSESMTTNATAGAGAFPSSRHEITSSSNLNDSVFSLETKSRSRANSLKSPFVNFSQRFLNDNTSSSNQATTSAIAAATTMSNFANEAKQVIGLKQYSSSSTIFGCDIDPPPEPIIEEDTYVSYLCKLINYGFAYEVTDILASRIATHKYSSANKGKFFTKDFYETILQQKYTVESKNDFYTNCLYLYAYLYFLNLYYGQTPIFSQSILEQEDPILLLLQKQDQKQKQKTQFGQTDKVTMEERNLKFNLSSKRFLEFNVDRVFTIPIDIMFRHFLFYNKLPQETEKIDLILEVIGFGYYYFINMLHLKAVSSKLVADDEGEQRSCDDDDDYDNDFDDNFNDTVIVQKPEEEHLDANVVDVNIDGASSKYGKLNELENNNSNDNDDDQVDITTYDTSKSTIFSSVNEVYTLVFVLLVLQTDHFNKNNKSKMLEQDFVNIINNFKKEDFKKLKNAKSGAKLSETEDSCLMFNLLTNEIIEYLYENITLTPLKCVQEVIFPSQTRNSSIISSASFVSPTSPTMNTGVSSALSKKKSSSFFLSSLNGSDDPYALISHEDVKQLNISLDIYERMKDPFLSNYAEFVESFERNKNIHLQNVFDCLNDKAPESILKLDHSKDISDILFSSKQATIKPNLNHKGPLKKTKNVTVTPPASAASASATAPASVTPITAETNNEVPMFVRIYKIGTLFKQESKISILPKKSKKKAKRRSRNFKNTNLNDSDDFVWKKHYAILTTFGLYIFKSINWDLLRKFEDEIAADESDIKRIKVYSSSFFLQSSNSELELAIPINKLFAYKYKYKDFNSFYVCYSNSENDTKFLKIDEVDLTNDWMSNPKSNKIYNKGLFYCDTAKEVDDWVCKINYLAANYQCLPTLHNEAYTNLTIPGYDNAHELTIGRHATLNTRHKELAKELKIINKLELNYERVLEFLKRLAPCQNKNKLRLRKFINKIYTNYLRSLWFEEFKIKSLLYMVEQTILYGDKTSNSNDTNTTSFVVQQRKLSTISMHVEENQRFNAFSRTLDLYASHFHSLLIEASESYMRSIEKEKEKEEQKQQQQQSKNNGENSGVGGGDNGDNDSINRKNTMRDKRSDSYSHLASQSSPSPLPIPFDPELSISPIFRATQFRLLL